MYAISVETRFQADHHVRFADGMTEAPHAHDWLVRVTVRRPHLDDAGMVADFERVREALEAAVKPFHRSDLNLHPELHGLNPTAEVVARTVFDRLLAMNLEGLHRVEVTEAPGCVAAFESG
jgi:6-pyruvoyltetrahydropterin/6-carboxytetrahydropterin synthase